MQCYSFIRAIKQCENYMGNDNMFNSREIQCIKVASTLYDLMGHIWYQVAKTQTNQNLKLDLLIKISLLCTIKLKLCLVIFVVLCKCEWTYSTDWILQTSVQRPVHVWFGSKTLNNIVCLEDSE